jgi:hypothetical protein
MDSNGTVNAAGNCHANPPHGKNLRPPTATFVNENFLGGNDAVFRDMDAIDRPRASHFLLKTCDLPKKIYTDPSGRVRQNGELGQKFSLEAATATSIRT